MTTSIQILNYLLVLLEVVVLFNTIIIVHELGHFLAARWRGLYVEEFGVWFGKPIWKKTIGGVVYSLGSIPAGGFVKLPQLAPMDMIEGESELPREKLAPISALDKIIVAVAGPFFSFLLAVLLACIVWQVGKPVSERETTTTIGYIEPGSPAEKADLRAGDKVLEVDGHPVKRFMGMTNSIAWFVVRSEGETIPFKIERNGKVLIKQSGWVREKAHGWWGRAGLRQVRIEPAQTPKILKVEPNAPAAEAGLKPGDIVTHVNGKPIYQPELLMAAIEKNPNRPVNLVVRRGADRLEYNVTPKLLHGPKGEKDMMRIGIEWDPGIAPAYPTPYEQVSDSVSAIGNMLGALFSKSDVKAQHFSGPIGIGRMYFLMLQADQGWRIALWFSVLFNVNLAILNLLPLPMLDGGHIVLSVIEGVRRKPLNPKLIEMVQTACALLLIGFLLYVTYFDIVDLPWKRSHSAETPPGKVQR